MYLLRFFVWIQGYGMTERMTKPTPAPTSAEELDINFYMNKLRTIRANCGLENADVSFVLFTSEVLLCFGGFKNFCSKLLNLRSHVYILNLYFIWINLFFSLPNKKILCPKKKTCQKKKIKRWQRRYDIRYTD